MKQNLTLVTFWLILIAFLVIAAEMFIPAFNAVFKGTTLFLLPIGIFSLLGLVLIIATVKDKFEGALKKFLLLTGSAALGFFVSVFLHNAFYALTIISNNIASLSFSMEVLHVFFFFVAVIGCPLGFLAGIAGTIYCLIKKGR